MARFIHSQPGRTGLLATPVASINGMSIATASGRGGDQGATSRTVISTAAAIAAIGESAVRWRLHRGRWQRPCRGVLVTHSGPISDAEKLCIAVLAAGRSAVLGGSTAAQLDGLTGFEDPAIHLVVPASRHVRTSVAGAIVHRSRALTAEDIHPARTPPRTRLGRSLLDAAAWARSDHAARAVLAMGVQQRLVRPADLTAVLARFPQIRRHGLITSTLADITGGAHALSELDFCRLTRRYGLPEPDRQVLRRDDAGRRRWLDAYWHEAQVVAEVDGLWHMEAAAWWADMRRGNGLTLSGLRVLHFPAFAVRDHPAEVAAQLAEAFGTPGSRALASRAPGSRLPAR